MKTENDFFNELNDCLKRAVTNGDHFELADICLKFEDVIKAHSTTPASEVCVCGYDYNYVVGFAIDPKGLVLIEKNKPAWQKGKLNGVGGKIEVGESPMQAITREFKEETGVSTSDSCWTNFCTLSGDWDGGKGIVYFFFYETDIELPIQTTTAERVTRVDYNNLPANVIPNLRWLIPMAISFEFGETSESFRVLEIRTKFTPRSCENCGELCSDKHRNVVCSDWIPTEERKQGHSALVVDKETHKIKTVDLHPVTEQKKPTIAELEKALDSSRSQIHLNPDGSITTQPLTEKQPTLATMMKRAKELETDGRDCMHPMINGSVTEINDVRKSMMNAVKEVAEEQGKAELLPLLKSLEKVLTEISLEMAGFGIHIDWLKEFKDELTKFEKGAK